MSPTPFSVRVSSSLCLPCEQRPSLPKDTLSLLQGAAQTPKASTTLFSEGILFDKLPTPQKYLLANKNQNYACMSNDLRLEKEAKEWRERFRRGGGIQIMRRNAESGSGHFILGMQVLSLRLMTSKLVSLVAQVTCTQLPQGPCLLFHC